jgi:uncharacterized membrane protein YczE
MSVGIVANLYSGLGMGPWGVFHVGITNYTALTLGQADQVFSLIILLIGWYLGFPFGFGTLLNIYFIGYFIDLIIVLGFIPQPTNLLGQFILLVFGIGSLGLGSFFYLNPKLGAGPRDGLMIRLVQLYDKPVGIIRSIIEVTVLIIGYLLGGPIGIGTIIYGLSVGYSVQLAFKLGGYDKMASHLSLYSLLDYLREE